MKKKPVTLRKISVGIMFLALFFLVGCSATSKPEIDGSLSFKNESAEKIVALENIEKAAYLKRIYEKDGKKFLEFDDAETNDDELTSLPIVKDVKVFLPNYYPEGLFGKLQQDLRDPNNKNIKDIVYYLTIGGGEVQAINRPAL